MTAFVVVKLSIVPFYVQLSHSLLQLEFGGTKGLKLSLPWVLAMVLPLISSS